MIKKNIGKLILSSLFILLPLILVFLVSGLLPAEFAMDWGLDGTLDGFISSTNVFFVMPLVMLGVHWLMLLMFHFFNQKEAEQNKKVISLLFWILPAITWLTCCIVFAVGLGHDDKISTLLFPFFGILFLFIGNYLPKTRRNFSIGIKVKWALANDDNWYATHRFGGKVFAVAGTLCFPAVFLPDGSFPIVLILLVLATTVLPSFYSYFYAKKQITEGNATKEEFHHPIAKRFGKKVSAISGILTVALILLLIPLLFTGSLETEFSESSFTVKASYWKDLTLEYEKIDSVEYRETSVEGHRVNGFSSAKLLMGTFRNDEFGSYTRYTYAGDGPCIVLKAGNRTVVLGAAEEQEVKELFEILSKKINKNQ